MCAAGEGLDLTGEPLIREESVEAEASGDGRPDAAGKQGQAEEEKEKSPSTDQQTQESEVCICTFPSCVRSDSSSDFHLH